MSDLFTELLDSINELPRTDNYTSRDRYADFRHVFMGSDQGKRVYRELLVWGKMLSSTVSGGTIDPNKVIFAEGHRNFVLKLIAAVNIEPPEQPTKTTNRRTITNPI